MGEYYRAYDERYRAVQDVGDFIWGHRPDDVQLNEALTSWVDEYGLRGRRVAEFACGEGVVGRMLAEMGCIYSGYDISPTAVEISRRRLNGLNGARVGEMDMVKDRLEEESCDGVLDVSGLHMLVTDGDREKYLRNVFNALKPGATALFWQEAYREDGYEGRVESIEDWKNITGLDFDTPESRTIGNTGREVMLRLLPARPRSRAGYTDEFSRAGFEVIRFKEIMNSEFMALSAGILVKRPEG